MSKVIILTYYGMEGTGPTLKEAKADASRKLEALQRGTWTPKVLVAATGAMALCWRTLTGWQYSLLNADGSQGGTAFGHDAEDCERRARKHLGSNETSWRKCLTVADVDPIVIEERDRREIVSNCDWQRRYHAAREAGLDDNNARNWIGGFTQFMTQPIPEALKTSAA